MQEWETDRERLTVFETEGHKYRHNGGVQWAGRSRGEMKGLVTSVQGSLVREVRAGGHPQFYQHFLLYLPTYQQSTTQKQQLYLHLFISQTLQIRKAWKVWTVICNQLRGPVHTMNIGLYIKACLRDKQRTGCCTHPFQSVYDLFSSSQKSCQLMLGQSENN